MIPDKIFQIGAMLGLKQKHIQDIIADKLNKSDNAEIHYSINTYKGNYYGTVSIKDFQ